jgi:hypothetical protein
MGTYNYYNPITDKKLHVLYDVNPYFKYGNTADDTTNFFTRWWRWWIKGWVAKVKEEKYKVEYYANRIDEVHFIQSLISRYANH